MNIKSYGISFVLLLYSFLNASSLEWSPVGNTSVAGDAPYGKLYKTSFNNIRDHQVTDKIHGVTVRLYKNQKAMKKASRNYLLLAFTARMSPYVKDYDLYSCDNTLPFLKLCFGFHDSFVKPKDYNGLNLIISEPLYRFLWTVRSGNGGKDIWKISPEKGVTVLNTGILFQRESIQFAPVFIQLLYDRKNSVMEFYLNGVFQQSVPVPANKKRISFTDFTLLWNQNKKSDKRRHFELSPLNVSFSDTKPEIRPAQPGLTLKTGKHYDSDFRQALLLLYGKENDWEAGFQLLQKLERKDHAPAIFELGCCYLRGIGCKPDREKALKYLKKAASCGVIEAADLWKMTVGLDPLTPELQREFVKENYLMISNKYSLLEDLEGWIRIGGNQKMYAETLSRFLQHSHYQSKAKKEPVQNELRKLADSGDYYARYCYAKILESAEQKKQMERSAKGGCVEAIPAFLNEKKDLNTLDFESQLEYACRYPLHFAGIKEPLKREQALFRLYSEHGRTKDPRYAFAYAESLLNPYLKLNDSIKTRSEQMMKQAAEKLPIAQTQYVRRYLAGDYKNKTVAKDCIVKLMQHYGKELVVKELYSLFLEKENPGKNLKYWQALWKENSIPAAYYLGEYAIRLGQKKAASQFRLRFLELDRKKRSKCSNYLFPELNGQFFNGFLRKFNNYFENI